MATTKRTFSQAKATRPSAALTSTIIGTVHAADVEYRQRTSAKNYVNAREAKRRRLAKQQIGDNLFILAAHRQKSYRKRGGSGASRTKEGTAKERCRLRGTSDTTWFTAGYGDDIITELLDGMTGNKGAQIAAAIDNIPRCNEHGLKCKLQR